MKAAYNRNRLFQHNIDAFMSTKSTDNKLSREDIVSAVAHLIAEQGLENLTMRNIARQVGCSVGTLPHYFAGKEDIVTAALNWSSDRIMSRLTSLPPSEINLNNLFSLLSASMPITALSDTEWRVRMCLWDYATTNEETRDSVNAINKVATEMLITLVIYLQGTGEIKKDLTPETAALSIYHMCIGAGFNMLHTPMEKREQQLTPLFHFIESMKG